jgi:hypothetical protein
MKVVKKFWPFTDSTEKKPEIKELATKLEEKD